MQEKIVRQVGYLQGSYQDARSAKYKIRYEIIWNANLMQQVNFIHVFLARHVSGTYAHHQEHQILSCSIWFSAPSFWMGGGLESRCVGRVCVADIAVRTALIKLPCCIKMAFQIISWGRCTVKQPSNKIRYWIINNIPGHELTASVLSHWYKMYLK